MEVSALPQKERSIPKWEKEELCITPKREIDSKTVKGRSLHAPKM
jgi:hypothetical protein